MRKRFGVTRLEGRGCDRFLKSYNLKNSLETGPVMGIVSVRSLRRTIIF